MIAVDTNLLVYAHREDSPWHDAAATRIRELAEHRAPWAIPWPCVHEFLAKGLFRNLMLDLFSLLTTPKKRVIAERQLEILRLLLEVEWMDWQEVNRRTSSVYATLGNPLKALVRDVNSLAALGAVKVERLGEGRYRLGVRVEWPTEVTETAFFEKLKQLPKARTHSFLR